MRELKHGMAGERHAMCESAFTAVSVKLQCSDKNLNEFFGIMNQNL
jgi:hypothetical protein